MSEQRIKAALAELSAALGEHAGKVYDTSKAPQVDFRVDWTDTSTLDGGYWFIPRVSIAIQGASERFSP